MTGRASGPPEAGGAPAANPADGLPASDPLAARLFPPLPGVVQWGLERTERLLVALGSPHRTYPVLHVGGTNGKGSVARIWAEVLRAAGFRTGLYTTPHLISFRERILVDGRPLPDPLLEEWALELRPLLDREGPSFFEASTAFAFLALARARVDVAVVEVGLGGRLDSTNVVFPVLTAITNVAPEHRTMLGDTVAAIATEKAGILKAGVPAFTAARDRRVLEVLVREAAERKAPLQRVAIPSGTVTLDGIRFTLESRRWGVLELVSPLVGRHQIGNVALAVRALEALPPRLPVEADAVREGVLRTRIPGRFQVEREGERTWILDVGHNPAAAGTLAETLGEVDAPGPRVGLIGILADKEWEPMLRELASVLHRIVLTVPDSAPRHRRWDPEAGARFLGPERAVSEPSFQAALDLARKAAGPRGTVVVAGSFTTVGDALRSLDRIPPEALPPSFDFG